MKRVIKSSTNAEPEYYGEFTDDNKDVYDIYEYKGYELSIGTEPMKDGPGEGKYCFIVANNPHIYSNPGGGETIHLDYFGYATTDKALAAAKNLVDTDLIYNR